MGARISFTNDELEAVLDRVSSAHDEHDPGDEESHEFWERLLCKVEHACMRAGVDARRQTIEMRRAPGAAVDTRKVRP